MSSQAMHQGSLDRVAKNSTILDNSDTNITSAEGKGKEEQFFREYVRNHVRTPVMAFENKAAKEALCKRQAEHQSIHSAEKNIVIFDIRSHNITASVFQDALWEQYTEATGAFTASQNQQDIVVTAFDSAEARDKACTCGVTIDDKLTIFGTVTVDANPQVRRVMLDSLPLLRAPELGQMVQNALTPFGTVLHVKLFVDQNGLFFGKGYAILDMSIKENASFRSLKHKITLESGRVVYAKWDGMPPHCNYCHKLGHVIKGCSKLKRAPN